MNNDQISLLPKRGGEEMNARVEDYIDTTCVASTGGGRMLA